MNVEGELSTSCAEQRRVERRCLPSRDAWKAFFYYAIQVQFVWIIVYGGASWITEQRSTRFDFSTSLDSAIPFVPSAAVIYLALLPLLWSAPLVLLTATRLQEFARSLQWLIVLAGVGFLLLPSDDRVIDTTPRGLAGLLFNLADVVNLKHNLLPSLHVGMAVVCAYVYGQYLSRTAAWCCWAAAALIACATLLTHQHYVADVIAGAVAGWLVASLSTTRPDAPL